MYCTMVYGAINYSLICIYDSAVIIAGLMGLSLRNPLQANTLKTHRFPFCFSCWRFLWGAWWPGRAGSKAVSSRNLLRLNAFGDLSGRCGQLSWDSLWQASSPLRFGINNFSSLQGVQCKSQIYQETL